MAIRRFVWIIPVVLIVVFQSHGLHAASKILSMQLGTSDTDCSCTSPGIACLSFVQGGFVSGEIFASRFDPAPADYPLQITKVYAIFGPTASGPEFFDLTIWEDSGSGTIPGSIIFYQDGYGIVGDESGCYMVDLSTASPPVCVTDSSKKIRVGFTYNHSGYPGCFRDNSMSYSTRNYIFTSIGWFYSNTLGVMGDWVMEIEIDTGSPLCGSSSPTPTPTSPPGTPTNTPSPTHTNTPVVTATPTLSPTPVPTDTPPPSIIYFDKSEYFTESDMASITVEDVNLNINPTLQDSGVISIRSTTDISGFSMDILETGPDTNIFATSTAGTNLAFSISASDPVTKTIHVSDGDNIVASYLDTVHSVTRTDLASWFDTPPTSTPTPPPSYVMFDKTDYCTTGDTAIITVFDTDLNIDPTTQQTVLVHVISNSDLVGIDMTLKEISVDSDFFTTDANGLNLTFDLSNSLEPLGILKIKDGDIVAVTYMDVYPTASRTDTAHWWETMVPCLATPTPSPVTATSYTKIWFLVLGFGLLFLFTCNLITKS